MTTKKTKSFTEANLKAWNQVAPIHARHNHADLLQSFRQAGFSCLDETETKRLNDIGVKGRDVAQLGCNNGREILSIKNLGAERCVGFDGASAFIDQANELASAAGQDVQFVASDIYNITDEFNSAFDVVYITIGVLGWMPDLEAFFAVASRITRPGGVVFIYEQHPILNMIKPADEDEPIEWELSYFDKEPYVETEGLDYYGDESYDAMPVTSFNQTMSEIIMAAITAGLQVEHFEEHEHHISNTWWNVEESDLGLPMCYTLTLKKNG